jgi:predicted acyl esterase
MFLLDGMVKGRYRDSYLSEELLEPGRVYEYEIDMGHIAVALAPGHRLRLAVSSSSFDKWDINPNTGEPYGDHAVTQSLLVERLGAEPSGATPQFHTTLVAHNTLFMDRTRPSQVILPVVQE